MEKLRQIGAAWVAKNYWGVDQLRFTDTDFEAWAKSLLVCANGDGRLTDAERDWVIGMLAAWGLSESLLERLQNYPADETIEQTISQSEEVLRYGGGAVVFCAIAACDADGQLDDDELSQIRTMAERLGLEPSIVDEALAIHREERAIIQKRIKLAYPADTDFLVS